MLASVVCYAGLLAMLAGALSLIRPLRFLHIRSRRAGAVLAAVGISVTVITLLLPARLVRAQVPAGTPPSALDELMPAYHFSEFHAIHVPASPERVYTAVKEVRPGEIRLFLLLTGIRSLRPGRLIGRGVAPLASQRPILEISARGGFMVLADTPREIVQGTCSQFWRLRGSGRCPGVNTREALLAFTQPGYAKALINFRIIPEGDGCRVTTETRILATDDSARRTFGAYWRLIYPGSALIRRSWLDAIARRATAAEGSAGPATLPSAPASASVGPVEYECTRTGGARDTLKATFDQSTPAAVLVERGGETRRATEVCAASGAKSEGPDLLFWDSHGEALVTWSGAELHCKPR